MRRLKVRLADIAREAQVSPATVDRTINGRPGVHERTARKIRQAIRRLEAIADSKPSPVIRARRLNFDVLVPAGSAAFYNVGGGSRGIGTALTELGRGDDVIFIGHGLTHFTRRFLIEGTMDAVINQDVAHMAKATLQHLLDFHGEPLPASRLEQPRVEVIFRENLP